MDQKTEQIKISFIIPVYNLAEGNYLSDCLESIECVRIPNMEVWIIDDGSTDRSGEICDAYAAKDLRFHVIHQPNAGVSAARNTGMRHASGEWLFFLDGDDLVPEELGMIFDFEAYGNVDVVLFAFSEINELGECTGRKHSESQSLTEISSDMVNCMPKWILEGNFEKNSFFSNVNLHSSWGKLYRREFLEKNGIHFEGLKRAEDFLFNLQIVFFQPRVLKASEVVYYYRVRSGSATHRYLPGIRINTEKAIALVDRLLVERDVEDSLRNALDIFIIREFLVCVIYDYCHPMNPKSYGVRRAEFRALKARKEIDAALRESNFEALRRFGSTSRISAFLCRKEAFFVLSCYLKFVRLLRNCIEKVTRRHI